MAIFLIGIILLTFAFLVLIMGIFGIALIVLAIGIVVVPLVLLFFMNIHWMDIYAICIFLFICAMFFHWPPIALLAIFLSSVLIFFIFKESKTIKKHWKPIFWILCIPGSLVVADIASYLLFAFFRIEFLISAIIVFALSIARHIFEYKQAIQYDLPIN
ncbi:MAG TPA: hypothetical protein DHW78_03625 [Ruminococcaceae bacterium]|jgi:hypothetical protein|nr:hypothetical protein [Oscillospiraceae bacterium]